MKACLGLPGRLWAVGSLVCDWPKPISYLDPRRGQGQGRKGPSQPPPIFWGLAPPLPNSAPCSSSSFYSLFSEVGKHPCITTCMHSLLLHGNIFVYGYTLKFPRLQALSSQTKLFLLHKACPCNESLAFETFSPSIPYLVLDSIYSALEAVHLCSLPVLPINRGAREARASWHTPSLSPQPSFFVNEGKAPQEQQNPDLTQPAAT